MSFVLFKGTVHTKLKFHPFSTHSYAYAEALVTFTKPHNHSRVSQTERIPNNASTDKLVYMLLELDKLMRVNTNTATQLLSRRLHWRVFQKKKHAANAVNAVNITILDKLDCQVFQTFGCHHTGCMETCYVLFLLFFLTLRRNDTVGFH